MRKEGGGLICLALTPERCDELGLDLMAAKNESRVRDRVHGLDRGPRRASRTGISARRPRPHDPGRDRPRVTRRASSSSPATCSRSRPRPGGVLERVGQTEAAVDLARLAGLNPAGVICEIMNDDGTMARVPDLEPYCERHGLKMITVADLVAYRRRHEKLVERVVATKLPTGVRRLRRRRLPLAGRQQAPRRAGQGRGRRRRATCSSACTPSA